MRLNTTNRLLLKLQQDSSPHEFSIVLSILKLTQKDIAIKFKVKQASISMAINNDPQLRVLRGKVINYLNSLQSKVQRNTHDKILQ